MEPGSRGGSEALPEIEVWPPNSMTIWLDHWDLMLYFLDSKGRSELGWAKSYAFGAKSFCLYKDTAVTMFFVVFPPQIFKHLKAVSHIYWKQVDFSRSFYFFPNHASFIFTKK